MVRIKKVAIIDSYEGNGHCFSFPAIINGWDRSKIHLCPFENITSYLPKYITPAEKLRDVFIATEVWMQNPNTAIDICQFAQTKAVAKSPLKALEDCDVAFLLNDEPDDRNSLLRSLISAKKPIFVDKLLARDVCELDSIRISQVFDNQVFCASALKYSSFFDDVRPFKSVRETHIQVPKTWLMYGVHAVEMFLNDKLLENSTFEIITSARSRNQTGRTLKIALDSPSELGTSVVYLAASGDSETPFSVKQVGCEGEISYFELVDPFSAFVRMLLDFNEYTKSKVSVGKFWSNQRKIVEILSK